MNAYLPALNQLLSTTTSRYNSLRRNILSSQSEDDSHTDHADSTTVSRVLRAYYTEKARPLPPWLPPDPREVAKREREREQAAQAYVATTRTTLSRNAHSSSSTGSGGGGLGDIWGDTNTPTHPVPQDTSLRRAAIERNTQATSSSTSASTQGPSARSQSANRYYQHQRSDPADLDPVRALPLPSQRAGSYQSTRSRYTDGAGSGSGAEEQFVSGNRNGGSSGANAGPVGSLSGRDRLKARMGSQRNLQAAATSAPPGPAGSRYR